MKAKRLGAFAFRRILLIPVSVLLVVTVSFGLVLLIPGDPAVAILGEGATPANVAALRQDLELDEPVVSRYVNYLSRVIRADLGRSFFTREPVAGLIGRYLPNTLELVFVSLVVATFVGLVFGVVGGYFQGRWQDHLASTAVAVLQALPEFVVALILIYFVFYELHLAPAPIGRLSLDIPPVRSGPTGFLLADSLLLGRFDAFADALAHLTLPAAALGMHRGAAMARAVRTAFGQAMTTPQVEFARACGLRERTVIRYGLLAARTPILTYGAILFSHLVGGAAIVETIFGWDGLGQWAVAGILRVDVPVIQGFVLVTGMSTLITYLVLDIAVGLLDPRIRYG